MSGTRKWRAVALLAVGLAVGTAISSTTATAHVGGTIAHLTTHLKQTFFTKSQSDARYLRKAGKAANADKLDGLDSSQIRVRSNGTAAVFFDIASCGTATMLSYEIEVIRRARIHVDGASGTQVRSDPGHDPSIRVQLVDGSGVAVASSARALNRDFSGGLSSSGLLIAGSAPYVAQPGSTRSA